MLDPDRFIELKASGNLPSPKGAALKVIELCQGDKSTLPEIIQVLQTDPAMVGRILKLANSATFGRPRPAAALTPDVLLAIGVQAVRQVVLAFSLVAAHRGGQCPGFDYGLFWSRSTATAVAAQLLGAATRAAPPAEMFTIGLLANVGRLALAALDARRYGELLARAGAQFAPALTELEKEAFGYTHLDVAAAMMRDWGLPKLFTDAVLFHESPELAQFGALSRSAKLVNCLHLGARLADICYMPQSDRATEYLTLVKPAHALSIEQDNLATLTDQMLREWTEWSMLLQLAAPDVEPFSALDLPAEGPAAHGPLQQLSILVVADDGEICRSLDQLLAGDGHTVHAAHDCRDGLAQALHYQPHVVIADLQMARQDGPQLVRSLRSTDLGRAIYIMALTMSDTDDTPAAAFDLGADDYLSKPVDGKLLQARLRAGMRIIHEQQVLRHEQQELRRRLLELSIANQRAQEAALTDVLTGLYNRRHAMERLTQEWAEAERGHRPLCVLMLDIDYFKAVNDQHGHHVGDAALRQFAEILHTFSRAPDVPCRFGGEEFLLIAPDTPLQGALQLAERIRSAVENHVLMTTGTPLRLTVSIGVAEKTAARASVDHLIKAADDALYDAKRSGRNRIVGA